MFDRILFPTDGSSGADDVLDHVVDIATAHDATLHLLYVAAFGADVRGPQLVEKLEERADRFVDKGREISVVSGVNSVTTAVEHGVSIAGEIRAYVEAHDIDLVVIGTHGRSGFDRFMLGSVAEKLFRRSPVPVLTVRERDQE